MPHEATPAVSAPLPRTKVLAVLGTMVAVALSYAVLFPPEPNLDPADISRETMFFLGVLAVYRYTTQPHSRLLEVGFILFLLSLWMEVVDEFTGEPRWVGTGVPAPIGISGLILIAVAARQLARTRVVVLAEKAKAEAELVRSHATLRAVVESTPDAVWVKDLGGAYLLANAPCAQVMGRTMQEVLGRRDAELLPVDLAERSVATDRAAVQGHAVRYEETLTDGGIARTYLISKAVIRDAAGEPFGTMGVARDISDRKAIEERLAHQASHDALTGLPNRPAFIDRLARALARHRRQPDHPFAVLFVDLDDFKLVNDRHGHATGDALLIALARSLVQWIRPGDHVARFGGDEFTVLLQDLADASDAVHVADRIQQGLASPLRVDSRDIKVSASIGIALSTEADVDADSLLKWADTAMYRAKEAGGARHILHSIP